MDTITLRDLQGHWGKLHLTPVALEDATKAVVKVITSEIESNTQ